MTWLRTLVLALLGRYGSRLRFPVLFALTALCFVVDLVLPDPLPFMDEIMLALATLIFAAWRRAPDEMDLAPSPERDEN